MKVLGISPLDKDSTISFIEDGRVVFACGEERLSRVKLQDGFPYRALDLGFELTGWSPSEIDVVAYAFLDAHGEAQAIDKSVQLDGQRDSTQALSASSSYLRSAVSKLEKSPTVDPIPGLDASMEFMERKPAWKRAIYKLAATVPAFDRRMHRKELTRWRDMAVEDHTLRNQQLLEGLKKYHLEGKLKRFNHHLTHAANAFYSSGYSEAIAVLLDGYGTGNAGAVYSCSPDGFKLLHQFKFPYSLGIFYEYVTSALGFTAGRHEGKIVGLAAYGDSTLLEPVLKARFDGLEEGDIRMHGALNYFLSRYFSQHFSKRDIAATYQNVLEDVVKQAVEVWVDKTGAKNVVVSGGVNANVKLNQRIHEIEGVDSVFVYPNMGDGGCATGAGLLAFEREKLGSLEIDNVYYGPEYSDEEICIALKEAGLDADFSVNTESEIGKLLSENRIIARFNGRMEYGPRALGNRSILYPAQDPEVNLWLNHQLGRTEFMPFAPACLEEHSKDLFFKTDGCEKTAQFMTITFDCTEKMKEMCPAAVHIDGTARPQNVSMKSNESFYKIIKAYYDITGIPAVINTSFNMHEEPIVCSPDDAIRAFLKGRMDYLAIGNYLVKHPNLAEIDAERTQTVSH